MDPRSGRLYYFNSTRATTVWTRPTNGDVVELSKFQVIRVLFLLIIVYSVLPAHALPAHALPVALHPTPSTPPRPALVAVHAWSDLASVAQAPDATRVGYAAQRRVWALRVAFILPSHDATVIAPL